MTRTESISVTERQAEVGTAGSGRLVVLLTGVFIAGLDFFIVNVAIPSIGSDLSAGAAALEWVVAGYGLPYGVGLITGARLGDRWGRRRMFSSELPCSRSHRQRAGWRRRRAS
jgi:predicted MFS family arabinose efflux permease